MNQETRVGLFLMVALALILSSILMLGNIHLFKRSQRFFVFFDNVEALPPKAAVKVAGVEIGKVARVELVQGRARVAIDVSPKVPVYQNAMARVGSTGIIGTKFIELVPGTPPAPQLADGATIEGQTSRSLNEMIDKLSSLFEKDEKYGSATDNIKETLANIRNVSRALNVAMGQHAADMEAIVMNVRDLTESAKVFTAHLEEISTARKEDVKVALAKFRDVSEKLDSILTKIDSGKGMIGTMVSDEKAGKDVKEAVASIKDTAASAKEILGRFTQINTYWDYRYRYDTRDGEGRSDIAVKIVPRPHKFYAAGATDIGEVPPDEKHTQYERKNRITGVIGADYGPFTGYAGAIRSRGGVGLNFRPLIWSPTFRDRFELTSEISDINRDRVVNGTVLDKPWVAAGGHFAVTRWMWLGARVEDLMERSAFEVYTNIMFRDQDLSYLLGFASLKR